MVADPRDTFAPEPTPEQRGDIHDRMAASFRETRPGRTWRVDRFVFPMATGNATPEQRAAHTVLLERSLQETAAAVTEADYTALEARIVALEKMMLLLLIEPDGKTLKKIRHAVLYGASLPMATKELPDG